MKMIVPEPINLKEIDKIVYDSFKELVELAEVNFALSYSNWEPENQPVFYTSQMIVTGNTARVEYSTDSINFVRIDDGTKAHVQTAKNVPMMKFPQRSIPRTRPGQLASFQPVRSKEFVVAKKVNNPGIKKREFSESVRQIVEEQIDKIVDKHHLKAKSF